MRILDQTKKLYKQFLFIYAKVSFSQLVQDTLEFHHIGRVGRACHDCGIEVRIDIGVRIIANPPKMILLMLDDIFQDGT